MIEILTLLTIVSLIIISLGKIKDKEDVTFTGIFIFVILVIFGWVLIGIIVPIDTCEFKKEISEISLSEGKYNLVVRYDTTYIFDKKIDFDNITDTTTFYLEEDKNMYGYVKDRTMFYKFNNRNYYSTSKY